MTNKKMTSKKDEAQARKWKVGDTFNNYTQTIINRLTGELYWFESSSMGRVPREQWPPFEQWRGPFKTEAECKEDQGLILLPPEWKAAMTERGLWNPELERAAKVRG
jgi:hypothetical protein